MTRIEPTTTELTLAELTTEVATRIASLPAQTNGQIRAVPDARTIRYYGTIGLLEPPLMRGRVAIYGPRHLAQVVAIKRLQSAGRSLAEIQQLWPTLDDVALTRMSGVVLPATTAARASRSEFWKRAPETMPVPMPMPMPVPMPMPPMPMSMPTSTRLPTGMSQHLEANLDLNSTLADAPPSPPLELRIQLAHGITLLLAIPEGGSLEPDDVRALRAAAAPLIELASRRLRSNDGGDE